MTRVQLTWREAWYHLNPASSLSVYDKDGREFRQSIGSMAAERPLVQVGTVATYWRPADNEPVWIDLPPMPEPPDGTRIEFEHHADVYAAWRDDESSVRAGYPAGEGWCLFGATVPRSWAVMWLEFGDSLRTAVRLMPHPDDTGNYAQWGTVLTSARGGR